MDKKLVSPRITHFSWGDMEVDGERRFKDAKLYPGGAREWDWNETGTSHTPGIQPVDVQELLDHGSQIVILSTGNNERLKVKEETRQLLQERGIEFHVLQSEDAVQLYNRVRERQPVGGLFHSTC